METDLFQYMLEIESQLSFLGQCYHVRGTGEVCCYLRSQVILRNLSTAVPLLISGGWSACVLLKSMITSVVFPLFTELLLYRAAVNRSTARRDIIVANEVHYCCFICKLNDAAVNETDAVQLWISNLNWRVLNTQPWGVLDSLWWCWRGGCQSGLIVAKQ